MSTSVLERTYPEYLYKNEGPFSQAQLVILAGSRVAVAGLGAFGLGAVGLAQLGVGTGTGGWLRLADPDHFEAHNSNRQAYAGQRGRNKTVVVAEQIRDLVPEAHLQTFPDGVTLENLDRFLHNADLVIDMVDYLKPEVKLELHRRARAARIPVVAGMLVDRGASGYVFDADSVSFDDFFAVPAAPSLLSSWSMPVSRIVVLPQSAATRHFYFKVVNGRHHIPSNALSVTASQLLVNHLAVSRLLGQTVPRAPQVAYLDPSTWSMGSVDLSASVAAQADSPWTTLAGLYDVMMETPCGPLYDRITQDLAGCARILEAGCGTGILCARLAARGHEVTGIDMNLAMLAHAAARSQAHPFLYGEGDVEQLFFEDASFDGYASINVVLHTDLSRTLLEARRVLRPGGVLALSSFTAIPDLTVLPEQTRALATQLHGGRTYPPLTDVLEQLQGAGFEPLVADRGFLPETYYVVARR